MVTEQEMIEFENEIGDLFNNKQIKAPIHLYHSNEKQAHGLSCSVPKGVPIPPSLRNIFKELNKEFSDREYNFIHGDLSKWLDREKIFLLNCSTYLT